MFFCLLFPIWTWNVCSGHSLFKLFCGQPAGLVSCFLFDFFHFLLNLSAAYSMNSLAFTWYCNDFYVKTILNSLPAVIEWKNSRLLVSYSFIISIILSKFDILVINLIKTDSRSEQALNNTCTIQPHASINSTAANGLPI